MIQYDAHRWWDHLLDVKGSMVREILPGVTACVVWSAGVAAFHRYVRPVGIPSTVHSLVGLALGLLLVFRTNASYDRFWEGRKLWGGIVNETRNLARASAVLLRGAPDLHASIVRWTAAWAYSTMFWLRGSGASARWRAPCRRRSGRRRRRRSTCRWRWRCASAVISTRRGGGG